MKRGVFTEIPFKFYWKRVSSLVKLCNLFFICDSVRSSDEIRDADDWQWLFLFSFRKLVSERGSLAILNNIIIWQTNLWHSPTSEGQTANILKGHVSLFARARRKPSPCAVTDFHEKNSFLWDNSINHGGIRNQWPNQLQTKPLWQLRIAHSDQSPCNVTMIQPKVMEKWVNHRKMQIVSPGVSQSRTPMSSVATLFPIAWSPRDCHHCVGDPLARQAAQTDLPWTHPVLCNHGLEEQSICLHVLHPQKIKSKWLTHKNNQDGQSVLKIEGW